MTTANRLTDIAIKTLKPKAHHYTVSDGKGLSLRVYPSGRKVWQVRKMSDGKAVFISLGTYPDISLAEARSLAQEQCRALAAQNEKAKLSEELTLQEAFELWLQSKTIRDSSAQVYRCRFKHLEPLAEVNLAQITPMQVRATFASVLAKGYFIAAHRAAAMLASIERFACGLGLVETPRLQYVALTIATPPTKHFRTMAAQDLPELYKGLSTSFTVGYMSQNERRFFLIITLMLFTLLRSHEAVSLKWEHVDLDGLCIIIPAQIMKKKREYRIPITTQLRKLLIECKASSKGEFVLYTKQSAAHKPLNRLIFRRILARAKVLDKMTVHGVRSMARSYFAEQGFDFIASEYCLAHQVENATQLSYQRTDYLEQRRVIMQKWCDYVESCYQPYFIL